MDMRSIDIDFDVHKAIEAARRSFAETQNAVLRRLLGLDHADESDDGFSTESGGWSSKGVTLPKGTELRMEYNGIVGRAVIANGRWQTPNGFFNGPSPAAAAVSTTRDGNTPSLNGWIYWRAKLPGSSRYIPIQDLRERAKDI